MGDMNPGDAGWGRLANSRKWHFIAPNSTIVGRAGTGESTLCGKAVLFRSHDLAPLENEADNHEDNCATCKRKVQRWRERNGYPAVDHA